MGQMAPVIQVHAHHRISRLQHSQENRHICLRAGMRLYIGIIAPKEFLSPLNGQGLYDIHTLTASVIAFAGVSFCIFIRQNRSHRHHHRF